MSRPWIEYIPQPGTEKVRCPRCGKLVGHQRMARGAHAAWCLRQAPSDPSGPKSEHASFNQKQEVSYQMGGKGI